MITILLFIVCSLLWYIPVYKKQGKPGQLSAWKCVISILTGALPVFIVSTLIQIGLGLVMSSADKHSVPYIIFNAFIVAGVTEELVKFLGALLLVKLFKVQRQIDYVLIFGGVGLGFHLLESGVSSSNLLSAVLGSILVYHMFWQFWMGLNYYEYRQASLTGKSKTKFFILAFMVPILLHGVNDFIVFMVEELATSNNEGFAAVWALAYLVWFVIFVIFIIITLRKVYRSARKSREERGAYYEKEH